MRHRQDQHTAREEERISRGGRGTAADLDHDEGHKVPSLSDEAWTGSGRRSSAKRSVLLVSIIAGVATMTVVLVLLLWPYQYHYSSITKDGKIYPLRIHRLTGKVDLYDGTSWGIASSKDVSSPTPSLPSKGEGASSTAPTSSASQTSPPPASPTADQRPAAPETPPRPTKASASDMPPPVPLTPPPAELHQQAGIGVSPGADRTGSVTLPEEKPSRKPPPVAKKPSPPTTTTSVKKKGPWRYAVQIGAFPQKERAKAQDLLKRLLAQGYDAHMQKVSLPKRGVWYRVLVGRFLDRKTALNFLQKSDLGKTFPGSFVQGKSRGKG